MVHAILYNTIFFGTVTCALAFGGSPERLVGVLFVVARFLTRWAFSSLQGPHDQIEIGVFFVDLGLFGLLYLVSLCSTRFWPIWMSGIQGAAVLAHSVVLMKPVSGFAYVIMMAIWNYFMLALLVIATVRHRARKRKFGSDTPWVSFSPRWARASLR